jgi:LmbE family N-acetylglucosaminyl deacetylase
MATMTAGDCGSAELAPEEIARVRRDEARQAARLADAEYHCLGFRDLSIVFDNESRRRVTEFLRKVRPDIVLTAPPVDYMFDHEVTSRLVRDATFNASIPNYRTDVSPPLPPTPRIPHLYYVDPLEGVDWYGVVQPHDFLVDVTQVFETKRAMLACHASQRDWLMRQHGIDEYLDAQNRWSTARGQLAGCKHAEAFRQHKGHPYPHDNLLVDLLH